MIFEEMIDKLLDGGIEITLTKQDGILWYNLNTSMKSDLLIAKSPNPGGDEIAISKGRYGHEGSIETWGDLMREVKGCLHGRDYMSYDWQELLLAEGMLKVTKTTTTTVDYQ